MVFLNRDLPKDFCSDLANYKHFISKSFYVFGKVMGWVYVILFAAPHAIGCLGNAFWDGEELLFFIKWLWTLALQVLTLDLPFTLPHNSVQTAKWLSSLSSTRRGKEAVSPCAFLGTFTKPVHSNERIPLFPKLPYPDCSFHFMLQHCVGKLGRKKDQWVKNGLGT